MRSRAVGWRCFELRTAHKQMLPFPLPLACSTLECSTSISVVQGSGFGLSTHNCKVQMKQTAATASVTRSVVYSTYLTCCTAEHAAGVCYQALVQLGH